jgi:hypothetical protein
LSDLRASVRMAESGPIATYAALPEMVALRGKAAIHCGWGTIPTPRPSRPQRFTGQRSRTGRGGLGYLERRSWPAPASAVIARTAAHRTGRLGDSQCLGLPALDAVRRNRTTSAPYAAFAELRVSRNKSQLPVMSVDECGPLWNITTSLEARCRSSPRWNSAGRTRKPRGTRSYLRCTDG